MSTNGTILTNELESTKGNLMLRPEKYDTCSPIEDEHDKDIVIESTIDRIAGVDRDVPRLPNPSGLILCLNICGRMLNSDQGWSQNMWHHTLCELAHVFVVTS